MSIDSKLSVNIQENQILNELDKLILDSRKVEKANQVLTELKSSFHVEDRILQNQTTDLKSERWKDERAKPDLIGQCSLNVDFNETINTLNELVDSKKIKPVQSEMNLVTQETLQLHEIVKDENLSKLTLEKNAFENKASSDLVTMRSALCSKQTAQEKEKGFLQDLKPDIKTATQDLILIEAINVGQNQTLQEEEGLNLKDLNESKNATKKLEMGHRSLSIDFKIADEKEGLLENEKLNLFKGNLNIEQEQAICVRSISSQQNEQNLEQEKLEFENATSNIISTRMVNINQILSFEKEDQMKKSDQELSNAKKSIENLNALMVQQINPQFSTGKLKSKKEQPCKANLKSSKQKIARKDVNQQLEHEEIFEKELINKEKCDFKRIKQKSICALQNQILESESLYENERPKKSIASRDLSEQRQQSILINKSDQLDTSENLDMKTIDIKKASFNLDQEVSLQVIQGTLLESEKTFKLNKLETKQAIDKKIIELKQGIQVKDIQLMDNLKQVEMDKISDAKANFKLIDQQAIIKKDVLTFQSSKDFKHEVEENQIKFDYVSQKSLQISEDRGSEKESSFDTKKPKMKKIYPIQFAEQIKLGESTSISNEYHGVQEKGKLFKLFLNGI